MFNTDGLEKARQDFKENRFCVIDNIIKEPWIGQLYKCLPTMNMGYWMCVGNEHTKVSQGQANTLNMEELKKEYRAASKENFSYWHRAKWILREQDFIEVRFPKVIEFTRVVCGDYTLGKPDTTFLDIAEYISEFPDMFTEQPSYSAYDCESWLTAHHDPKRWLAYIFYFNPGWKAHWGGQLCIMNQDEITIKHSIEPFGNRLVIMDVSETFEHRINKHFISPVSYVAPYPRYSLAGWFYPKAK